MYLRIHSLSKDGLNLIDNYVLGHRFVACFALPTVAPNYRYMLQTRWSQSRTRVSFNFLVKISRIYRILFEDGFVSTVQTLAISLFSSVSVSNQSIIPYLFVRVLDIEALRTVACVVIVVFTTAKLSVEIPSTALPR